MKKIISLIVAGIFTMQLSAQKKLQELQPTRLGIFKNGTCFVKREGLVSVTEKSFYIKAPNKVLMGTYWLFVGKETSLNSVVVKTDTFKTSHPAKYLADFLLANVGENVTLYSNAQNADLRKLTGKLISFDAESATMKVATTNGKTVIAAASAFDWLETAGNPQSIIQVDSIIPIAKVKVDKAVSNVMASTISLEKGVQWYPSYLFSVLTDKEAKLEMKATIANGETDYGNMPVDIIIGNPEMFYGEKLDPVCIEYLSENAGNNYSDNFSKMNASNVITQSVGNISEEPAYNWENNDEPGKDGEKTEDLFYYKLGSVDLEKNARVIVPVMSTNITYSEVYNADLPLNSTMLEGASSVQTYHSYLLKNNTNAPLTSGAVLVMNVAGQPLAQTQLNYTPVQSSSQLQLSRAVDVQVKNDEEEISREKSNIAKKNYSAYYEKVTQTGSINITNYKDKKITVRVTKRIDGVVIKTDNNGKSRKIKTANNDDSVAELYWEVEVAAGAKIKLQYSYFVLE